MDGEERYSAWIADYIKRHNGSAYGLCKEATEEMVAAFPELRRVAGHVFCLWGQRSHFWCVTESGEIVDPTASQFGAVGSYEEWKPGAEVCVGKCMECGSEIWEPVESLDEVREKRVCSEVCSRSLEAEYGRV